MVSSPRTIVQAWVLVVAGFVVGLKVLDRVPAMLVGTPHGVRVYATLETAEQALGARIWLPAYYPDTLEWPPERVDTWPGPPDVAAVHVRGRADQRERLVVVQSIQDLADPPRLSCLAPAC